MDVTILTRFGRLFEQRNGRGGNCAPGPQVYKSRAALSHAQIPPARLERATFRLAIGRSILLSYGGVIDVTRRKRSSGLWQDWTIEFAKTSALKQKSPASAHALPGHLFSFHFMHPCHAV